MPAISAVFQRNKNTQVIQMIQVTSLVLEAVHLKAIINKGDGQASAALIDSMSMMLIFIFKFKSICCTSVMTSKVQNQI